MLHALVEKIQIKTIEIQSADQPGERLNNQQQESEVR